MAASVYFSYSFHAAPASVTSTDEPAPTGSALGNAGRLMGGSILLPLTPLIFPRVIPAEPSQVNPTATKGPMEIMLQREGEGLHAFHDRVLQTWRNHYPQIPICDCSEVLIWKFILGIRQWEIRHRSTMAQPNSLDQALRVATDHRLAAERFRLLLQKRQDAGCPPAESIPEVRRIEPTTATSSTALPLLAPTLEPTAMAVTTPEVPENHFKVHHRKESDNSYSVVVDADNHAVGQLHVGTHLRKKPRQ
jgi:hypothetical protein